MPPRNTDKNKDVLKDLEKTISPVLVVNNSSLKPYVELFEYEPENIYQQPLGSLIGFFEVKEYSDESAYVVNFLTSVLKKEYYINPKRQVTESLDSALHKVNLALSELAKNGNVEWLGKINAAICVLEKNNAHFSVSGNAKIFLYRNKTLSEISADLASDSTDPHPLKTFVNVSSGRLEKNDRMLITSEDIFHILPAVEIKKNFQRFQDDKFVQFLKTALSNQLEMIASIVVDLAEPVPAIKNKQATSKKVAGAINNAFSKTAFPEPPTTDITPESQDFNEQNLKENNPETAYTDKKTGHIYIQGEAAENSAGANAKIGLYLDLAKEKISQGTYFTKNEIRKRFSLYKKQLAKKQELRNQEKERLAQLKVEQAEILKQKLAEEEALRAEKLAKEAELEKIRLQQEKDEQDKIAKENAIAEKLLQKKSRIKQKEVEEINQNTTRERELSFAEKLELAKAEQQKNTIIDLRVKNDISINDERSIAAENFFKQKTSKEEDSKKPSIEQIKTTPLLENISQGTLSAIKNLQKQIQKFATTIKTKKELLLVRQNQETSEPSALQDKNIFASIIPHFSRITNLFSRFTLKQKIYTLCAFLAIFIVPLFIVHFLNKPKIQTTAPQPEAPLTQSEKLANEKNINLNTQTKSIFQNQNIVTTLIANNNPTVITKNSVVILPASTRGDDRSSTQGGQNNQPKEFSIPADSGDAVRATYMKDLSLVLIFTDNNKIISFSPISEKIITNNIDLSNISSESPIGTYLTYLYVLDQKNNQIYRFPRADGGFGEKASWLKDSTPLANISEITIDDNIYAISNNKVLKFFKGKVVDFTLESSTTPVTFNKIYTTPDLQNFYALDTQNSRLIAYSKDGNILTQYYNETLKDGTSLSIDEQNKLAYIATSQGLFSLSLQ